MDARLITDQDGQLTPVSVKPGDRVLLPGWGGSPIKVGDEVSRWTALVGTVDALTHARQEYHLFKDSEILAKINE